MIETLFKALFWISFIRKNYEVSDFGFGARLIIAYRRLIDLDKHF